MAKTFTPLEDPHFADTIFLCLITGLIDLPEIDLIVIKIKTTDLKFHLRDLNTAQERIMLHDRCKDPSEM